MIQGLSIYKNYTNSTVLQDVSILAYPGKITVITGPSGSGKTTLLKCLALLENPEKGSVVIDDFKAEFPRDKNVMFDQQFPKLGIVFQNLFLWPHLTNEQNITLALGGTLSSHKKELYNKLIGLFDMRDFVKKYPNQSSLGQKQRVALVRTLMLEPQYLLLDEITASLDIEQSGVLLSYLEELKKQGVGIIIVTHFLMFAQKAADQVIFLENGRIVESGNNSILQEPKTKRLQDFLNSLNDVFIKI